VAAVAKVCTGAAALALSVWLARVWPQAMTATSAMTNTLDFIREPRVTIRYSYFYLKIAINSIHPKFNDLLIFNKFNQSPSGAKALQESHICSSNSND
jgi:hypothetical protein